MAKFNIDGRIFTGNDINIINGKVYIDGTLQDGTVHGVIEIKILEGVVRNLTSDAKITCGNVTGDVSAGMEVRCNDVGGNVSAGMDVTCGKVSGDVTAGMDINMRK